MTKVKKLLPAIFLLLLLFILTFSVVSFYRISHPARWTSRETPREHGLDYQEVEFKSADGYTIKGWFIPAGKEKKPAIIVTHGFGADKSDVLVLTTFLHKAGYHLFLFDFRGHGEHPVGATSFGYGEQKDIVGVLDYLTGRSEVDIDNIGGLGISMGGSAMVMVAAKDKRLKALWLDSPYESLDRVMDAHLKLAYRVPKYPFAYFGYLNYLLWFGKWPTQVSTIKDIDKISPRPIFIINGADDVITPPWGAHRLNDRAQEPKGIWIVPGARHTEAYGLNPQEYEEKARRFFQKAFKSRDQESGIRG